jgi:hypothetical protein
MAVIIHVDHIRARVLVHRTDKQALHVENKRFASLG